MTSKQRTPKPPGLARLERWQRAETLVHQVKARDLVRWEVPSASGNGVYLVEVLDEEPTCTCPDQTGRQLGGCKHIHAVRLARILAAFRQQDLSPITRQVLAFLRDLGKAYRCAFEGNWDGVDAMVDGMNDAGQRIVALANAPDLATPQSQPPQSTAASFRQPGRVYHDYRNHPRVPGPADHLPRPGPKRVQL